MRLALTTDTRPFLHAEMPVLMDDAGLALPASSMLADSGAPASGLGALIECWSNLDRTARRDLGSRLERSANQRVSVSGLRAPVDPHAKILIVTGRRYATNALDRMGPMAAMVKFPSACADPGQALVLPSGRIEADAVLGIVIGKQGTYVSSSDAIGRIAGFTLLLDVWDRDSYEAEAHTNNGLMAKNLIGLSPVGPSIWLPEQPDPASLPKITFTVNGVERQSFTLDQLAWTVEEAIAHWSAATLNPGDIVALGAALLGGDTSPPPPSVAIAPGDRLSLHCGPIGTLECDVRAAGDRP